MYPFAYVLCMLQNKVYDVVLRMLLCAPKEINVEILLQIYSTMQ